MWIIQNLSIWQFWALNFIHWLLLISNLETVSDSFSKWPVTRGSFPHLLPILFLSSFLFCFYCLVLNNPCQDIKAFVSHLFSPLLFATHPLYPFSNQKVSSLSWPSFGVLCPVRWHPTMPHCGFQSGFYRSPRKSLNLKILTAWPNSVCKST